MIVGYCCNVHPGKTLEEVKANLDQHACEVKRLYSPDAELPIGLWLSKAALADVSDDPGLVPAFGHWLHDRGLVPFTFNGFPYGDFHQEVVKKDVYLPTWAEESRLQYTLQLAQIQRGLLECSGDKHRFQSISTLPLGWPEVFKTPFESQDQGFVRRSANNQKRLANELHQMEQIDGVQTMVCIEPEPGCVLDTADDIAKFFDGFLFDGNETQNEIVRRHVGICHDICHSAVMFEHQEYAIQKYESVGAAVGKVQVSSAIAATMEQGENEDNQRKLNQLREFSEPRYLHQTRIQSSRGNDVRFFEDLGQAIDDFDASLSAQWRVHFHVPLFLASIDDMVDTTQQEIAALMDSLSCRSHPVQHFEIETYAWNVLPDKGTHTGESLAHGIAKELSWFRATHT